MTPAEILRELFPYFALGIFAIPGLLTAYWLRSLHVKVKWLTQVQQAQLALGQLPGVEDQGATVTELHQGGHRPRRGRG